MRPTPLCRRCGARHPNFKPCSSATGHLSAPVPDGFKPWGDGRSSGTKAMPAPVPEGYKVWGDVVPFSQWKPKDDGPKAA